MKNIIYLLLFINFQFIIAQSETDSTYIIKNVEKINNKYSNFGVSYFKDNKIIFSSPKKSQIIKSVWEENNEPFLDLFIVSNDSIKTITTVKGKAKTPYNESNPSFANNFKTVYFTRNNYHNFKLKKDQKGYANLGIYRGDVSSDTKWTNIKPISLNNVNYSIAHPSFSSDGKTMYFTSDMPGGYGKTDIYKVTINSNGTFEQPINLGDKINTTAKENFPFISEDNILYFSSDRQGGKGNLDIYYANLASDGAKITNLSQLNTVADDFAFVKKKDANEGYFSSNRRRGKGKDDIYSFTYKVKKSVEAKPCAEIVSGYILDEGNNKITTSAVVKAYDKDDKLIDTKDVAPNTKYEFELPCSSRFKLITEAKNYLKATTPIVTDANLTLIKNIVLNKRTIDYCQSKLDNITLNAVYFGFNKYSIKEIAKIKLNKIVSIMKECSEMKLVVGVHTDSRGTKVYNKSLSMKRAQAIRTYLVQNGIDSNRIQAFGYGESQLLNRCKDGVRCTSEEHQKNRRAEFKIIKQ